MFFTNGTVYANRSEQPLYRKWDRPSSHLNARNELTDPENRFFSFLSFLQSSLIYSNRRCLEDRTHEILIHYLLHELRYFGHYRQTGWIGTVEVNRDTGIELEETQRQNVSPGSIPMSRFTSTVPIHPVCR